MMNQSVTAAKDGTDTDWCCTYNARAFIYKSPSMQENFICFIVLQ